MPLQKTLPPGRGLPVDPENTVFVSAVSLWEIRLKQSLGKLQVPRILKVVGTVRQDSVRVVTAMDARKSEARDYLRAKVAL